jgi:subtilisin family serine protease
VLVDMRVTKGQSMGQSLNMAEGLSAGGFQLDTGYEPVPTTLTDSELAMDLEASKEEVVTVRGTIDKNKIKDLQNQENVVDVWLDTEIAPFGNQDVQEQQFFMEPSMAAGDCPIPPCDCDQGTAACSKGSVADVARYLGVDQIWETGKRGQDIVIGIVDGGITAKGRPIKAADTNHTGTLNCPPSWPMPLISRVIGGWPTNDWGTTGVAWCWHGNMTATDALGMAPQAKIYDIRISDGNAISNALAGFQWAMNQHKKNGTPHILSNSWGIFQESWDPTYARNPNHPFTRKVVEAINQGILVLFAAGNCGKTCPSGRCGNDVGPNKSIWGANGHPSVITVGAANIQGRLVGYSSQGPAALDSYKPDFCSISHFTGYFECDTGTSAACPVAAGVVALLKQCKPSLTQDTAKKALKNTATNIGPHGWDQHSGSGIIQAKKAYDELCAVAPDTCRRYSSIAQRYLSIYRATGNSSYLSRYYHYLLLYFWCRYKATGNRSDLAQCRTYHALSLEFV